MPRSQIHDPSPRLCFKGPAGVRWFWGRSIQFEKLRIFPSRSLTQVLESLAKNGIASRAEITDAAMGERAECVMLNKGPYILTAVRILGDILRRMQPHHEKKNSMLRKLHLAVAFHTGA
jgi:hypothetical protein